MSEDIREVDVVILGAGTAGLNAVREVRDCGRSWLLVDPGPYGTTCARVGCMPSKLLIAAAEAAHGARTADLFGVRAEGVTVDSAAVMERLRRERDRFVGFVVEETESLPEENRLLGCARFVGPTSLEVQTEEGSVRVETRASVIATGSSPFVPDLLEPVRERVLTSASLFELETLPRSLAVIGTGVVGLELGQALSRLGVEVAFFDRVAHPGPCTDPEVNRVIQRVLAERLVLHSEVELTDARMRDDAVELVWKGADGVESSARFEAVLAAAGRPPNLGLDLEKTGLALDDRGRPPWSPATTQCGELPIFLAGDANGTRPLLHEAGDEGRIGGANAARWPEVESHDRRVTLHIVFSDPQIAMVGTPFDELDRDAHCIGEVSFRNQGRARVMGLAEGLLRVYARRSDCVLVGAEMFGPRMEHLAHLLAWAVQEGMRVQKLLAMPIYHPTFEEGMRTALRDLARGLAIEGECRSEDLTEAPGM